MSDYSFFVEGPVSRAASMAGIDKQDLINQYGRARASGVFGKGSTSGPDKKTKSGQLRISFPHLKKMFEAGYAPDIMKKVGLAGKRPWAGYKGEDAVTPQNRSGGGKYNRWGSPRSGLKPKGGGGGGGGGGGDSNVNTVNTPPGDPWNANNWNPYTPMSGFVQGFQPWDPINFTLDPSLQGTQPTFQPGGFMDPVPQWNANAAPWPNFPNPSPPPVAPRGGGGGSSYNPQGLVQSSVTTPLPGPSGPMGANPSLQSPVGAYWPQAEPPWGWDPLNQNRGNSALDAFWDAYSQFFGRDGTIGDSWGGWGGSGGGGRELDPWAFKF